MKWFQLITLRWLRIKNDDKMRRISLRVELERATIFYSNIYYIEWTKILGPPCIVGTQKVFQTFFAKKIQILAKLSQLRLCVFFSVQKRVVDRVGVTLSF